MIDLSFFTAGVSVLVLAYFFMTSFCWITSKMYKPRLKTDVERRPFLSVLIPAKDEGKAIPKTLRDLQKQTAGNYEVVVLVNNCKDNTMEESMKFSDDPRFKIVEITDVRDKAETLNKGLKYARGSVIVVLDADTRTDEKFIEKLTNYFRDSSVNAVQPRYEIENKSENLLTALQNLEFINFSVFNMGKCRVGESALAGGICIAVRKNVIYSVCGWDSCLTEDYSFVSKLIAKGYKVTLANDIVVKFQGVTTWSDLLKQRSRWLKGHLDLSKKTMLKPQSLFNFLFTIAPVYNALIFMMFLLFYLYMFFLNGQIRYFYLPIEFWVLSLAFYVILLLDLCINNRFKKGIPIIPAYIIYTLHWVLVLFYIQNVNWNNTRVRRY